MTKKPKTKYHHWLAANPLRKYILGKDTPLRISGFESLAEHLGVTKQCVHAWMSGLWKPSLSSLSQLQEVTKITPDEWLRWWNQRPTQRKEKNA